MSSYILLLLTETVQLAIVAGIGGFVTGLIPSIFAYISLQTARQAAAEVAATQAAASALELAKLNAEQQLMAAKADHIIEQGVQIHTLTNNNLSQVTSQLKVSDERVYGLEQLIKSMVSDKAVADNLATRKEINGARMAEAYSPISPVSDVPIPVVDDQVANLMKGEITDKLDSIQEDVKTEE